MTKNIKVKDQDPLKDKDPLNLAGFEPDAIEIAGMEKKAMAAEKKKGKAEPTEVDIAKEKRLLLKEQRMSGVNVTNAPPPPPPDYTVEEKSALLDKLGAYRERFPHLKKRNNVSVKSSGDDILDELHYCEVQLGSRQDSNVGGMILHGAMVAVETIHRDVYNPLGLNLNGLGKVTKDNMAEFQPIVDELMIKYGTGLFMGPEMRLALAMGALVMTVHGANSGDVRIASALEKMNTGVKIPVGSEDL